MNSNYFPAPYCSCGRHTSAAPLGEDEIERLVDGVRNKLMGHAYNRQAQARYAVRYMLSELATHLRASVEIEPLVRAMELTWQHCCEERPSIEVCGELFHASRPMDAGISKAIGAVKAVVEALQSPKVPA